MAASTSTKSKIDEFLATCQIKRSLHCKDKSDAKQHKKLSGWTCDDCTFINTNFTTNCEMCKKSRSFSRSTDLNVPIGTPCTGFVNFSQNSKRQSCNYNDDSVDQEISLEKAKVMRNLDNTWDCPRCTIKNDIFSKSCKVCHCTDNLDMILDLCSIDGIPISLEELYPTYRASNTSSELKDVNNIDMPVTKDNTDSITSLNMINEKSDVSIIKDKSDVSIIEDTAERKIATMKDMGCIVEYLTPYDRDKRYLVIIGGNKYISISILHLEWISNASFDSIEHALNYTTNRIKYDFDEVIIVSVVGCSFTRKTLETSFNHLFKKGYDKFILFEAKHAYTKRKEILKAIRHII